METLTLPNKWKKEADHWESLFQKCKEARTSFERDWYLNMAFYFGKQYVTWTPAASKNLSIQRLVEPPAPRYRVRLVANKIMPAMRTELVKLTKEEPQFYVKPESSEPSDVASARVGESLFEYCLEEYGFNKARRRSTFWALMCGTAFLRTAINDDLSLDYLPTTAFHLFAPDLMEEDIQKQEFLIHARAVNPQKVRETYNVSKLTPTVENTKGAQIEDVLMSTMGVRKTSDQDKQCYLKEIWIRPNVNPKYPDGALITIVDGTIMDIKTDPDPHGSPFTPDDELSQTNDQTSDNEDMLSQKTDNQHYQDYPYEHGMYPFQKIDHVPTGRFYADSAIKYLIPLQKEYNCTRSQIIESKNRMGKPQMMYVKGSLDPNMVTSEPGLMIPIMPGMDFPKPVEHGDIPGYVIQELDRTLRDMDDIVQYEGAKNATPPGVEAASAIAYLQEENDSRLYSTVASIEEAVTESGKQTLSLVQQFWPPEKIVEVVSKNNTMETYQFVNGDTINGTDLRVETGSMAPKSQAAQQAFITELMKLGLLPPEKGLRYLQLNETNRLYDELQAANRMAQRENFKIAQGMIDTGNLPVNSWDNDGIHIYEHELFMNSQEFELLDPQLKAVLEQHYLDHKLRMMGQLQGEGQDAGGIQPGVPGQQPPTGNPNPAAGSPV